MKIYSATIRDDEPGLWSREVYYARQQRRFILLTVLVLILPLLVIGWASSHYYKQSWLQHTRSELSALAESRREIIDLFLANQENQLAALGELYDAQYLQQPENLQRIFTALARGGVIVDLGVVGLDGRHLAYAGPYGRELADRNYRRAEWFQDVLDHGRHVSDVFRGYRGEPHFVVAVADSDSQCILRATIDSDLFNALLAGVPVGPGGEVLIINRQGQVQAPVARTVDVEEETGYLADLWTAAPQTVLEEEREVIYAVVPLEEADWLLVLKTDVASSLADFYQARNLGILIVIVVAVIILTAAVWLVRTMMAGIERADAERMVLNNRIREMEKMALMGRLAAGVAHEINNPLQLIGDQTGWMDELLGEEDPARIKHLDEYRQAVVRIRRQVTQASSITRRLLGLSRSGEEEMQRLVSVELNPLVQDTISFLANEAKKRGIEIHAELAADLPLVRTDTAQFQQVLLNILNNAIDAVEQDGTVTVNTGFADGWLRVMVADTGPGLLPEVAARIFDPFFTTKGPGKGTGLGLSLSRNIIQRLGGDIEAANREDGGAVFTIKLPTAVEPGP